MAEEIEQPLQDSMENEINNAFQSFKNRYPSLEKNYSGEILNSFKDFIAYFYTSVSDYDEGTHHVVEELKESNPDFNFQTNVLMESAMQIADRFYCNEKDSLQYEAEELAEQEADDEDEAMELKWDLIDYAKDNIKDNINITKCFEDLIKVQMQKDGMNKAFHENGKLKSEGNWKDDKQDGLHKGWFENGQIEYECNWQDGVPHGISKNWNDSGELLFEVEYENGKELFKPNILPLSYHEIKIYEKGGDVKIQDSDKTYNLTAIELSIYDAIIGAQSGLGMMGMTEELIKFSNIGIDWFQATNSDAHKILF